MPTINKKTEDQVTEKFNEVYKKMWKTVKTKRSLSDLSNKEFIREVEEFIASY